MITLEEARDIFYLDPTSPSGLRWKIDKYSGVHSQFHCVVKDSVAGSSCGYWKITYNYTSYQVHRIITMLNLGIEDSEINFIDHEDGNGLNNDISNLKLSCPKLNSRNKKMSSLNKSGTTGVFIVLVKGKKYARAQWYDIDGNRKTKNFSFLKYGDEKALEMAADIRNKSIQLLQIAGANYSERHGK